MIIPFIIVKNARETMNYYQEIFQAKMPQEAILLSSIPGFEGEEYKGKISHGTLIINGTTIFVKDQITVTDCILDSNIELVFDFDSKATLTKAFNEIAKDGEILEDLSEKQWCTLYGVIRDRYNIVWQLYFNHK